MNKLSSRLALLFSVLAALSLASCSQPSDVLDDSPEATAFRARQGLMRMIAWKVAQIRAMTQGEIEADDALFTEYAVDLAALSHMLTDAFIPGSDVEGSGSLPEVWTSWSDFEARSNDFSTAADGLASAAQQGGMAAGQSLVQGVAQTCSGCHRTYRRREE